MDYNRHDLNTVDRMFVYIFLQCRVFSKFIMKFTPAVIGWPMPFQYAYSHQDFWPVPPAIFVYNFQNSLCAGLGVDWTQKGRKTGICSCAILKLYSWILLLPFNFIIKFNFLYRVNSLHYILLLRMFMY